MKSKLITVLIITSMMLISCNENNNSTNTKNVENSVSEFIIVDTDVSSSDEALQILKEGNARFATDKSVLRNINAERRESLKNGQNPYAVIVSCSDSRVTPTTVFNAGLGELFDIRLAGNVVDDDALGSIEYAVEHLNTPLIVVMGHQSCGAVTATYNEVVKGEKVSGNMESFVKKITPSVNKNGTIDDAIHTNIDMVVKEISEDKGIKTEKTQVVIGAKVPEIKVQAIKKLDGNVYYSISIKDEVILKNVKITLNDEEKVNIDVNSSEYTTEIVLQKGFDNKLIIEASNENLTTSKKAQCSLP